MMAAASAHRTSPIVISAPSGTGSSTSTLNLDEDYKRWVVVGICLHRVVVPVLRKVVKKEITKHYDNLEGAHNISAQSHTAHLCYDASFKFKYESINNNWANHKRKERLYDYTVKSPEELGKLYLQQHMAQFTAFDNTCDASALLGILFNASVFNAAIKSSAESVRTHVRNEWGHCNVDSWDASKFLKCFQFMETLIRNVGLKAVEEKKTTDDLTDWQNKGLTLCMGCPVDEDLMKLVGENVKELKKEVDEMKDLAKEETQRMTESLKTVSAAIDEFHVEIQKVKEEVAEMKASHTNLKGRVHDLEGQQEDTTARITAVEEVTKDHEERLQKVESSQSGQGPSQEAFIFQQPDRNEYFCGREEQLLRLEENMKAIENECKISAVSGLGGMGKTSLVVEHTWQQKGMYEGGVFWVSGESEDTFHLSVCDLARQVGLEEEKDEKFQHTLSKTLTWLQRRKQLFCLVVDNLDEMKLSPDMKRIFIGSWRRGTRGHIVVTSRREPLEVSEEVRVKKEECIELQKMTEKEGLEFLKKRTESASDEDATICELVGELGGLPLALDQAASYIRCSGCGFSSYLETYKEERASLLKKREATLLVDYTSPERLAVHTTWSLNFEYVSRMSHDRGLGKAVALVMEMSAYFAPDDIPFRIINQGRPPVDNEDLQCTCASGPSGVKDILSILTRFSLFQRHSGNSYSVHRLVQEVIRDGIEDERVLEVLGSAVRMLHFSFSETASPVQVCTNVQETAVLARETYPSLQLWGRLALHACTLLEHLLTYAEQTHRGHIGMLYSEETVRLLNEASVYLNVSRETDKARKLHHKKVEFLMQMNTSTTNERVTIPESMDIPLQVRDFTLISQCMKQSETSDAARSTSAELEGDLPSPSEKLEQLRLLGRQAVQEKDYQKAVDLYTQAIGLRPSDHRLFSNRALCYLKLSRPEEALEDCEMCLERSPLFTKALMRKAWALNDLVKGGVVHLKNRAQAVADLTVHTDSTLSVQLAMFTKFSPKLVKGPDHLTWVLNISTAGDTLLLEEGDYNAGSLVRREGLQIVGLGNGATFSCTSVVDGCTCYFENIKFPKGSPSIVCTNGAVVSFYHCQISGGSVSCENYPECNGGPGCVAVTPCNRTGKYGYPEKSGVGGDPGIQIVRKSTGYIDNCRLIHCGGGGMLSAEGSTVYVNKCEVFKNHQSGLEARSDGRLIATSNRVYDNGCHGILIGANAGPCEINKNKIFENSREGMLVVNTAEVVKVENNDVYQNAPFGLSLSDSNLVISKNRIFENGFWGILANTRTTAFISENELYSNKCGGIYMGINFSGRILLDSNVVRDHTGPWLRYQDKWEDLPSKETKFVEATGDFGLPPGETRFYTHPPILRDNKEFNNERERSRQPQERTQSKPRECAYCHRSANDAKLLPCSKCYIAAYCRYECQRADWRGRHKVRCALVAGKYSVTVEITPCNIGSRRGSRPKSTGRRKAPKPSPTSRERFIVKVQTQHLNGHPRQMLAIYDRSFYVDGQIQSPDVFNVVTECGVLQTLDKYTSKEAYFWAAFAGGSDMKITIFLSDPAPLEEW